MWAHQVGLKHFCGPVFSHIPGFDTLEMGENGTEEPVDEFLTRCRQKPALPDLPCCDASKETVIRHFVQTAPHYAPREPISDNFKLKTCKIFLVGWDNLGVF